MKVAEGGRGGHQQNRFVTRLPRKADRFLTCFCSLCSSVYNLRNPVSHGNSLYLVDLCFLFARARALCNQFEPLDSRSPINQISSPPISRYLGSFFCLLFCISFDHRLFYPPTPLPLCIYFDTLCVNTIATHSHQSSVSPHPLSPSRASDPPTPRLS